MFTYKLYDLFNGFKVDSHSFYRCSVAIEQIFEEGKDYELSYKWLNNRSCNLEVFEVKTDDKGNPDRILLYEKDNTLPFNFSKSCLTKFKSEN